MIDCDCKCIGSVVGVECCFWYQNFYYGLDLFFFCVIGFDNGFFDQVWSVFGNIQIGQRGNQQSDFMCLVKF